VTSYSTVQKQQLSQLGAYLQEKRQEQGKSLEDISLQTYIRAQLLKSLETGDTSDLPQPIFVQGFIRRYADALGLDGTNFAKQFPVHSIPNTPRPGPRPATSVDMLHSTTSQKPPAQSKSALGALPIQNKTDLHPAMKSVGALDTSAAERTAPQPTIPEKASPEKIAPEKDTNTPEALSLDPNPMSDSELAALGLGDVSDDAGSQSPKTYQSSPFAKEATKPETSPSPEPSAPVGAMPVEPAKPISANLSDGSTSTVNWLPWGIGAAAVLVGAISLLVPRIIGGGSNQQPETLESAAPQTEIVQTEAPLDVPEPEPEPEPEPTISDAPVNLQVEITEAGPSWMSVIVDGELVFEGLMDPGTTEIWEGQESISMNVGNAGAALISANGSDPVPAGNPGGAEFLEFTADTD
jgi:cytoskeletal protein RodZ